MSRENEKKVIEEKITSLDLLWDQSIQELDAWSERVGLREETLRRSTKNLVENIKRNQKNRKELIDQFLKEQSEWEKVAREELLTSTTSLQYIFPIQSYQEINNILDTFRSKTVELYNLPLRPLTNEEPLENYMDSVEKYIEYRKKTRVQFINNVKETLKKIQENQSNIVHLFTKQIKNVLFPFNKYIERYSEEEK
jgi:hypothetical protein